MHILCRIFGHKLVNPNLSSYHYLRIIPRGTDGINRYHGMLQGACHRCHKGPFNVAMVHYPEPKYDKQRDDPKIEKQLWGIIVGRGELHSFAGSYYMRHSKKEVEDHIRVFSNSVPELKHATPIPLMIVRGLQR